MLESREPWTWVGAGERALAQPVGLTLALKAKPPGAARAKSRKQMGLEKGGLECWEGGEVKGHTQTPLPGPQFPSYEVLSSPTRQCSGGYLS